MLRCLSSFIYIVILLLVCWIRLVSNYFGLIKVNGIQKLKVKGRNIQRWYKTIEHGAECKRLAKHILTKNSWVRAGDHESTFGPAHQEHCGVDQREFVFLFFFVCFFSLSLSLFLSVCLFVCLSCFISVSLSLSLFVGLALSLPCHLLFWCQMRTNYGGCEFSSTPGQRGKPERKTSHLCRNDPEYKFRMYHAAPAQPCLNSLCWFPCKDSEGWPVTFRA